eukprot:NODE_1033_length_1697_cov_44.486624_g970_i0.p1 GENE.NODE_1033_length_1697_cov_44.486624_g970_i0~~NODE_1033_length_1697_cov_44.486624_g970_i0.p1  ORF type:complete len:301 (-),score=88.47 NODE_1033_length_1697_cov_44.486624_g970_i0:95-997(-)
MNRIGDSLYRLAAFIDHSCLPNCTHTILCNGDIELRTSKDIDAHAWLTLNYLPMGCCLGTSLRHTLLYNRYGFHCTCAANTDSGLLVCPTGDLHYVACSLPSENGPDVTCDQGHTTPFTSLKAKYDDLWKKLKPFVFCSPQKGVEELGVVQAIQQEVLAAVHPHHHLALLGSHAVLDRVKPFYEALYIKTLGERSLSKALPHEMMHFIDLLDSHKLVEVSTTNISRLAGHCPEPLQFHHTMLSEILMFFQAERRLPGCCADTKEMKELVEYHLSRSHSTTQQRGKELQDCLEKGPPTKEQ